LKRVSNNQNIKNHAVYEKFIKRYIYSLCGYRSEQTNNTKLYSKQEEKINIIKRKILLAK
jgi:hypothetical protein